MSPFPHISAQGHSKAWLIQSQQAEWIELVERLIRGNQTPSLLLSCRTEAQRWGIIASLSHTPSLMPHHYTTFPQFTQRPDYFSICVHWSEALQHNNLFRCRINKPIMLWMAHRFSKRAQCVASVKNEHHIGCRPHFGERLWRQMSFHHSILLLNFNISCAGNTEWARLLHHRKWSGLFNHAI